jgi:hypothetical protein
MYRWRNTIATVNSIALNSTSNFSGDTVVSIAKVNLHQPCVNTTDNNNYDGNIPVCDETKDLTCVVGLYKGNDDGNTGVCLSSVGGFCNAIYDCEPNAHSCINNICEQITETINLPCRYDSDCIGGATCRNCTTGIGPCIDSNGNCAELVNGKCPSPDYIPCNTELIGTLTCTNCTTGIGPCKDSNGKCAAELGNGQCPSPDYIPCNTELIGTLTCTNCITGIGPCINSNGNCEAELGNGQCPSGYNECNTEPGGEFRFSHVCDKDLNNPVCKYNVSPKDQGCTRDSDCIKMGGEAFCYKGHFKTAYDPTGELEPPTFNILSITDHSEEEDKLFSVKIDFGDKLITAESFFAGTEVNFVKGDETRTTISIGKYFIKRSVDNDKIILGETKLQPDITKYWNVPHNLIQQDEADYKQSSNADLSNHADLLNNPRKYKIVFGILPPLTILSKCYVVNVTMKKLKLVDTDLTFILSQNNVEVGVTKVRFNDKKIDGFISNASAYTITGIESYGEFTVDGDISTIGVFNQTSNLLEVMFGDSIDANLLNVNRGVCVSKLPPSANIGDSRYNISKYTGNPCIQQYDGSFNVSLIDGFCKFTDRPSGVGSVCQIKRGPYDPLPCESHTKIVDGLSYDLKCLIADDLTGYIRNNPNFLNYSFGGVCAYPVNRKFKTCNVYNNSCRPPYVCTQFGGGSFCDSRLDILQCNVNYSCPPRYECDDGLCLSISNSGICTSNDHCLGEECGSTLSLKYYDTISYVDRPGIDNMKDVPLPFDLSGFSINAKLKVKSIFFKGELFTYCLITEESNSKFFVIIGIKEKNQTLKVYEIEIADFIKVNLNNDFILVPSSNGVSIQFYDGIAFDKFKERTITVTPDTDARPSFITSNDGSTIRTNYRVTTDNGKKFPIPHYIDTFDQLIDVRFDYRNINNTELDIITIYKPSDTSSENTSTNLALRHKVMECVADYHNFSINGKSVLSPRIKCKQVNSTDDYTTYTVNDPIDINTLLTFSGYPLVVDVVSNDSEYTPLHSDNNTGKNVRKMIYFNNEFTIIVDPGDPGDNGSDVYFDIDLRVSESDKLPDFLPYNIKPNDYKSNFNNTLSPFLKYPTWLSDLNDLVVGDSYYPRVKHVYFEPNLIKDTYYIALDMHTGYNDPEEEAILNADDGGALKRNKYLFKFSSSDNQLGIVQDQAIPLRFSDDDENYNRLSVCNETDNIFFLTYTCD